MSYFGKYNERFTILDFDGIILDEGGELEINEPEDFSSQSFSHARNDWARSFITEHQSEDSTSLVFDDVKKGSSQSPYSFINEFMDLVGFDGVLYFRSYRTPIGGVEEYKEWKMDLYTIDDLDSDRNLSCNIKRVYYNDKLRTRLDVTINIESSEDLDGNTIDPLVLKTMPLHSRGILLEYEADYVTVFDPANFDFNDMFTVRGGGSGGFMKVGFSNIILNELSFDSVIDETFVDEDYLYPIFNTVFDGVYSIDCKLIAFNTVGGSVPDDVVLRLVDSLDNVTDINLTKTDEVVVTDFVSYDQRTYTYDDSLIIEKGTEVYLFWEDPFNGAFFQLLTEVSDNEMTRVSWLKIDAVTYIDPSTTNGDFMFNCIDKAIQKAVGDDSYIHLTSTLLESIEDGAVSDGDGALNFVTSGNKIRGIDKSLDVSIQSLLDFLIVRYNAGFVIINDDGDLKMRIERSDYFFQDVEILAINNYVKLIDRTTDLVYNQIDVGYSESSQDNEQGTNQSFNGTKSYLFPIESVSNTLDLTCESILDGVELERLRRLSTKQQESDDSDEKVFIVKCHRFNSSNRVRQKTGAIDRANRFRQGVQMDGANTITLIGYYLQGAIDDVTEIDIGVNFSFLAPLNEGTYTINTVSFSKIENKTIITTIETLAYTGIYNDHYAFNFDVDFIIPERIEDYEAITGIVDKYSVYNIAHAPSNILIDWFNYLGGSINEKDDSKKVIFTDKEKNVSLSKRGGVYTGLDIISESQDFTLGALRGYNPSFMTRKAYELECYLDYDSELNVIIKALNGEYGDTKDWGYISTVDSKNNPIKIYPTELKYKLIGNALNVTILGYGKKE